MRITCSGRLGGVEIARRQMMHQGRVPLHTLRADIDYGLVEAHTTMGRIGVKVWIYRGDILPEIKLKETAEEISVASTATPVKEAVLPVAEAAEVKAEAEVKKPRTRKKAVETPDVASMVVPEVETVIAEGKPVAEKAKTRVKKTAEAVELPKIEEKTAEEKPKTRTSRVKAEDKETKPKAEKGS